MHQKRPTEGPAAWSRRAALKAGAATGVAAVVWSEPTIRGIARRPAYAAAGSTVTTGALPLGDYPVNVDTSIPGDMDDIYGTPDNAVIIAWDGFAFIIFLISDDGCDCTFDEPVGFPDIEILNTEGSMSSLANYESGEYVVNWNFDFFGEPGTVIVSADVPYTCVP